MLRYTAKKTNQKKLCWAKKAGTNNILYNFTFMKLQEKNSKLQVYKEDQCLDETSDKTWRLGQNIMKVLEVRNMSCMSALMMVNGIYSCLNSLQLRWVLFIACKLYLTAVNLKI